MLTTVRIRRHELGLRFADGDFVAPVPPGKARIPIWRIGRDAVEVVDSLKPKLEHPMLDVLVADARVRERLLVLDLADGERALVWKDGRLLSVVGPGRHAYWRRPGGADGADVVTAEVFAAGSFRFDHPKLQAILQHPDAVRYLDGVQVSDTEAVLLFRDGVLVERLAPGLHVFWKGTGNVKWKALDLREQVADVAGQEIITSDKVSLRVNLLVTYRVADPVRAITAVADASQALYREAQLCLRAAVGTKPLDQLLADKESVGGEVREALVPRAAELGVAVRSVGLRDIVLPGDMKTLLNQVIAASKEAEANLIRRREETAAARSQANTAKLLSENPQLARLKELEMLKDVLSGTKATFVFGPGDVVEQVRSLVSAGEKPAG